MNDQIEEIIYFLEELKEEMGVSKTFKQKTEQMVSLLQQDSALVVKKALMVVEEMNQLDLSSYLRTKVWEVASMLESV